MNPVGILSGEALSILSNNINVNKAGSYQIIYGADGLSMIFTVGDPQTAWTFNIGSLTLTRRVNVIESNNSKKLTSGSTAAVSSMSKTNMKQVTPTYTSSKVLPATGEVEAPVILYYLGLTAFVLAGGLAYQFGRKKRVD